MNLADTAVTDPKVQTMRRALRNSTLTILLCFGVVGGWLYAASLDSAAVAPGVLENAATTKTIQHLEGGIVREIAVRNGDVVRQGDLLVRLDPTRSEASAALVDLQLFGSKARRARLEATVTVSSQVEFEPELTEAAKTDPEVAKFLRDEQRQFELARNRLLQEQELLQAQIRQAEAEIEGLSLRRGIARREIVLVNNDLADQEGLLERGLTSQSKVTQLTLQSLALEEKIAQSQIDIARINQAIAGLKLQISSVQENYRKTAAEELETINREIRSLQRDSTIANDSLRRVEVRAPVDGSVQESILGTVGAVVGSGETIMKIVPLANDYVIEAEIAPNDIDNLLPGSAALITFPAFQSLEMKPAEGALLSVSRDRVTDPRTQRSYYEAVVRLDEETLPSEVRTRLVAGMSVTVILPTGERSALEYIVSPLSRRLQRAMREE